MRDQRIRDAARGQPCTLRLPYVCDGGGFTTVFAHSNRGRDGKGLGLKASDDRGAFACYKCHVLYDRQSNLPPWLDRIDVEEAFDRGMAETRRILADIGLLK